MRLFVAPPLVRRHYDTLVRPQGRSAAELRDPTEVSAATSTRTANSPRGHGTPQPLPEYPVSTRWDVSRLTKGWPLALETAEN
jgi:hypothetical protein